MFIQVIEGRSSDPEAVHRRIQVWEEELRPGAEGFLGSAGGCTDDGHCILVARFADRASAMRNSNRPEQSAWWAETEQCFEGPVTFHDTEDVHVMQHGDLDSARFVQVMEGHVADRAGADRIEQESDRMLAEARPDLLGSYTAYFDDGEFADVAFFTDEQEAREAEQREVPPEMVEGLQEFQRVLPVERYLDLHEPWITRGSPIP
ncbi:MAG TPA: hypothetical protein VKZ55_04405 [Microthrixaceae bacterium]|nr:hypothetical protein [Microthrixaceae bacterium]